ncbi:MAG: helix-turn-helix domain-containing protein [Clostridia bacterium]|nr:helix-turn-helix domain-containing protein [Clostridia bacterium]
MEKKTIGQFIAALRKANGMTQKQLSEKLNVSDKAVSRWERDECAPDLSLIPVIAELFGVTSDEILRGERRISDDSFVETHVSGSKSTKQLERILNDTKLKFGIRSVISLGIAVLGLLGAMLFNFGFNRAHIGFIVGCIFLLATTVCEAIFIKLAFASVSEDEFDCDSLNLYKKGFFHKAYATYSWIFIIFALTLPLSTLVGEAYWGLSFNSWFCYGIFYGLVALLICVVLKTVVDRIAIKYKVFTLSEKEKEKSDKLFRFDRKCLLILVCIMCFTFVLQLVFNVTASIELFCEGQNFTTFEDFAEFMATPAERNYTYYDGLSKIEVNESLAVDVVKDYTFYVNGEEVESAPDDYFRYDDETHYFDQYGNEISEEEALTREFYGKHGEVYGTYIDRNDSVSYYTVDWDEDKIEKITVYTTDDMRDYHAFGNAVNQIFVILYFAEILAVVVVWFVKRRKI